MIPLTLLAALAVAAPVPKSDPAFKLKETFGEIVDPTADIKCEATKTGALRVSVPKESRALELTHGFVGAPVTTKTVEGDFVLTVRVSHAAPTKADKAEGVRSAPTVSAGVTLYAEGDPKTNITLVHKHTKSGDKWGSGMAMQTNYKNGSTGSGRGNPGLDDKPVYLRLTRKADFFTAETSADGKKWVMFAKHSSDKLGPSLVVGPTVLRNADADHVAEFDDYEIKPLTEEKK